MWRGVATLFAFVIVTGVSSCRDTEPNSAPTHDGSYQYVAVDSAGVVKESGVLNLTAENAISVQAELVLDTQELIQLGGTINEGTIHLERTVGCHDCFYTIAGTIGQSEISGTWNRGRLITENKGTFIARRL